MIIKDKPFKEKTIHERKIDKVKLIHREGDLVCTELWKGDDYTYNHEIKLGEGYNENGLRVWCNQYPDSYYFQIRTHLPINRNQNGKPKDMIAGIHLSIEDVERILAYMKAQKKSFDSLPSWAKNQKNHIILK